MVTSSDLQTPEWKCSIPLERGRSYWWVVSAVDDDKQTWQLPSDSESKPKFMVLGSKEQADLAKALELTQGSAILRFLVFVEFGLLDDAEKSLGSLETQNPDSSAITAARRMFDNLRRQAP